jgi:hypothetical protein
MSQILLPSIGSRPTLNVSVAQSVRFLTSVTVGFCAAVGRQLILAVNIGTRWLARLLTTTALIIPALIGGTSEITVGDVVYTLPPGWEVTETTAEQVRLIRSGSGDALIFLGKTLGTDEPEKALTLGWSQPDLKVREITAPKSEQSPFGRYTWSAGYIKSDNVRELYYSAGWISVDSSRWTSLVVATEHPDALARYYSDILILARSARLSKPLGQSPTYSSADDKLSKQLVGGWEGVEYPPTAFQFKADGSYYESCVVPGGDIQAVLFAEGRYSVKDGRLFLQELKGSYEFRGETKPFAQLSLKTARIVHLTADDMRLETRGKRANSLLLLNYRKVED